MINEPKKTKLVFEQENLLNIAMAKRWLDHIADDIKGENTISEQYILALQEHVTRLVYRVGMFNGKRT